MPEALKAFVVGDGFLALFCLLVIAILIFVKIKEAKRTRRASKQRIRNVEPKLH